jgi:serine/threonine protein kinase
MSPEQVKAEQVDQRSDIFSLGCVLYEMLCGTRPFHGANPAETLAKILYEDPPTLGPPVPQALQRIVSRCLEKRPEDRFSSAHDLALALEALQGLPAQPVQQPTEDAEPSATAVGKPRRWLLAAAAVLVVATIGVLAWWQISTPKAVMVELAIPPPVDQWLVAVQPFENRSGERWRWTRTSLDRPSRSRPRCSSDGRPKPRNPTWSICAHGPTVSPTSRRRGSGTSRRCRTTASTSLSSSCGN